MRMDVKTPLTGPEMGDSAPKYVTSENICYDALDYRTLQRGSFPQRPVIMRAIRRARDYGRRRDGRPRAGDCFFLAGATAERIWARSAP